MRRAVGVMASPRTGKNTDRLLESFLDGARASGMEVRKYVLAHMHIRPCLDCRRCQQTGHCVIEDDAPGIYAEIVNSDVVVLASPLYFLSVSAQAKVFIDRAQAVWPGTRGTGGQSYQTGAFLCTAGRPCPDFQGAVKVARCFFRVLNIRYEGELLVPGTDQHPVSANDLLRAFDLGRKLGLRPQGPPGPSRG